MSKKIVVLGGGEAGLETALRLRKKVGDDARIVLIHDDAFFTYRQWLTHVFRQKSISDITVNLDFVLSEHGIKFVQDSIKNVSLDNKSVELENGSQEFDFLVLALPEIPSLGVPGAEKNALTYHGAEDAEKIRNSVRELVSEGKGDGDITITVCGGGPAGIELVTELNEFLDKCCDESGVRRIDVKLVLIEKEGLVLPKFPLKARSYVTTYLGRQGIDVRTATEVKDVGSSSVTFADGTRLSSDLVIWCGGIRPSPLFETHKLSTDSEGSVIVNPYRQSVSEATIYAAGNSSTSREVNYKGPEISSLGNIERQCEVVAHNIATNINHDGEKKDFEFKKTPLWLSLGQNKSLVVWKDFVFKGRLVNFFANMRENKYLKRWK